MNYGIQKEEYFYNLAMIYISGEGVLEGSDKNEIWFDVANINGKDLRMVISRLNNELKEDGLIIQARIYGSGEGHLWFTDKGMDEIERIRSQL